MKKIVLNSCMLALGVFFCCACAPLHTTLKSSHYKSAASIERLHLVVIGSKETTDSFRYLKQFMQDSLTKYFTVSSAYNCCVGTKTSVMDVLQSQSEPPAGTTHVLLIAPQKHIVGYGTSSTIEYKVGLFNLLQRETEWEHEMSLTFSWFVNDEHYKKIGLRAAECIMLEMRNKSVVAI